MAGVGWGGVAERTEGIVSWELIGRCGLVGVENGRGGEKFEHMGWGLGKEVGVNEG